MNITPTHHIISMKRGETSGSKSPMWRCQTKDGQRVNIFQHTDPAKNSYRLFEEAGYSCFMMNMLVGEEITWNEFPVPVALHVNGNWLEVVAVAPVEDTRPDPQLGPDVVLWQRRAQEWAWHIRRSNCVVVWDTETTGLTQGDEIISIAGVNIDGTPLFNLTLQPTDPELVNRTTHIHGFTAESVKDAPSFAEAYTDIFGWLNGAIWVIYNAAFDTQMLKLACIRAGVAPILPLATVDAMEMFSTYYGEWNPQHMNFMSKGLQFAREMLKLPENEAHDALADAKTTAAVIRAMALLEQSS